VGDALNRREFLVRTGVAASLACAPAVAQPQAARIPRIGYVQASAAQNNTSPFLEAFRQGLRELGYVEGRNIQLEIRWSEGRLERLPAIARELVELNVDVLVAVASPAVIAAKAATKTIPIVMPLSSDPVGDGIVESLAHPGGNITGLSTMTPDLGGKRLQLLKDLFQQPIGPLAVMWNPDYTGMRARFRQTERAAPAAGMGVRSVEVRDSLELELALKNMDQNRPDALLLMADPLTLSQRLRIVEFAAQERLPAIYESSQFVDAGGLMSYGVNQADLLRRAAVYVDRILKGAKPGDLPIEQPAKFELVINLKTAKALGLSIPPRILLQADRVIE
jgi:putative tryptophan/tyrosine transport system substrate-binding protein